MDFHSLTRRELQSLCKLNKIPANLTNVAMADALQSLEIVVGIEELLNGSQSETADLVESVETVELLSPKAPQTRCRTATRKKAKPTETENLLTVTKTTRRGIKQMPREVEEPKNDMLNTPAVSRSSRKAPATSTRRNVSNQLNECENEPKEEGLVENKYSTRRSTRLTEQKSAAPSVKKGIKKAVKIDSFLDQGNSNAEVEDICNAFEKLDVVVIEEEATPKSVEEEDSGEVSNLKQEADEDLEDNLKISEMKIDEVYEVKPESDGISSPSEEAIHKSGEEVKDSDEVNNLKQDLEENLKTSEVKTDLKPDSDDIISPTEDANLVQEVNSGDNSFSAMKEHNPVLDQEHSDSDDTSDPCEDEIHEIKENNVVMAEENSDCLFETGVDAEMGQVDTPCADSGIINDSTKNPIDEITTEEMEEVSENNVNEIVDAIPTIDNHSTMSKEVKGLNSELVTENNVYEKSDAGHSTHVTPFKKATPFENMTEEVEDLKADFFTENNVNENSDADSGLTQNPTQATPFKNMSSVVSDDKENMVGEGKNKKDQETEKLKNYTEISIRQLKKQLKALTLKNNNSKEEEAAAATRPALQPVCENQMVVGGETEN